MAAEFVAAVGVAVAVLTWGSRPAQVRRPSPRSDAFTTAGAAPVPRRASRRLLTRPSRTPLRLLVAELAGDLAALLRAGSSPAAAWHAVAQAPPGDEVDSKAAARIRRLVLDAAAATARGDQTAEALRRSCASWRGTDAASIHALASVCSLAQATGAPIADSMERLAAGLRSQAAADDARTSALAAPTASARVLLALPVAGLGLGAAVGMHPVHVLLGTPGGRVCGAGGVLLDALAWLWTRELLRRARRAG